MAARQAAARTFINFAGVQRRLSSALPITTTLGSRVYPRTGISKAEVYRAESSNPFKDYVPPDTNAASFVITWSVQNDDDTSLTKRTINASDKIQKGDSSLSNLVQVTQPFYVLDGSGGKMASMCLFQHDLMQTATAEDEQEEVLWTSGSWLNQHSMLNQ